MLYFDSDSTLVLDLRKKISATARIELGRLGFEHSFGVVTAQDPLGAPQTPAANERLAATLRQEVAALRCVCASVNACNSDRSHCEQSIAAALDLKSLIAIAHGYAQLAIFWFDGNAFWIIPVRSSNERLQLPVGA